MLRWIAVPVVGFFGCGIGYILGTTLMFVAPEAGVSVHLFVVGVLMVAFAAFAAVLAAPSAKCITAATMSAGVTSLHFVGQHHFVATINPGLVGSVATGFIVTLAASRRFKPFWIRVLLPLERAAAIKQRAWFRQVDSSPGKSPILVSAGTGVLAVVLIGAAQLTDLFIHLAHIDPDLVDSGFRLKMFFWLSLGAPMVVLGFSAWIVSVASLLVLTIRHGPLVRTRLGAFCLACVGLVLIDCCFLGVRAFFGR